jgi:hypothetical protein
LRWGSCRCPCPPDRFCVRCVRQCSPWTSARVLCTRVLCVAVFAVRVLHGIAWGMVFAWQHVLKQRVAQLQSQSQALASHRGGGSATGVPMASTSHDAAVALQKKREAREVERARMLANFKQRSGGPAGFGASSAATPRGVPQAATQPPPVPHQMQAQTQAQANAQDDGACRSRDRFVLSTTVPLYHCTTVPLYHCTTVVVCHFCR